MRITLLTRGLLPMGLIVALGTLGCERQANPSGATTTQSHATSAPAVSPATAPAASQPAAEASHVRVYYFHRTLRCATCLSIEKQAQEAVETGFGSEIGTGQVEWQAVNIEEPDYQHFERDFELDRQALVLTEVTGDRVTRSKKLEKVWELVDDPRSFQSYVWTELSAFLGSAAKP